MTSKLLLDRPERVWVLVFTTGDEVISELTAFARQRTLTGTRFIESVENPQRCSASPRIGGGMT
jgi:predicted DNA-binding protein with PD1-like motif